MQAKWDEANCIVFSSCATTAPRDVDDDPDDISLLHLLPTGKTKGHRCPCNVIYLYDGEQCLDLECNVQCACLLPNNDLTVPTSSVLIDRACQDQRQGSLPGLTKQNL
jgi:hypothetical protein